MYNLFGKALNDEKGIQLVFCDHSKAFGKVWHPIFIRILHTFGITGSILQWFNSYLSDRRERVAIRVLLMYKIPRHPLNTIKHNHMTVLRHPDNTIFTGGMDHSACSV